MIRVIRQPIGSVNGLSLNLYKPGRCYDVDPAVAEFLVVSGYALIEMRKAERRRTSRGIDDRRRKKR
jgi:hypothetical protein